MSESIKSNISETRASDKHANVSKTGGSNRPNKNIMLGLLGATGCLLGVSAICLAGIIWWQQKQEINNSIQEQSSLKSQHAIQVISLNKQAVMLKKLQQQYTENTQQLISLYGTIKQLQVDNKQAWKFSETEYLLRAASLQLQTERNVTGAMHLLKLAKNIFDGIHDTDLFFIKKALVEDIAALNNITVTDITDCWLQLNALITQIHDLPVLAESGFDAHANTDKEEIKNAPSVSVKSAMPKAVTWNDRIQKMFSDSWHFFSEQFYFRKNDKEISFLVSPKEEVHLKENMSLMLMQAQQALLTGNKIIYQETLSNVINLFNTWFHNDSSKAKSILDRIESLKKIDITPIFPAINRALKVLQVYKIQLNTTQHHPDGNSGIVTQDNSSVNPLIKKTPKINNQDKFTKEQPHNDGIKTEDKINDQQDALKEHPQEKDKMDEAKTP